jgi:hypothetical protein
MAPELMLRRVALPGEVEGCVGVCTKHVESANYFVRGLGQLPKSVELKTTILT